MTKTLRLSIRHMLLLITGVFTLIILALSGSELVQSAAQAQNIAQLRRASDLSGQMFLASESLTLERDITHSLLAARDPVTEAAMLPELSAVRAQADQKRDSVLAALMDGHSEAVRRWDAALRADSQAIASLRLEIDRALAQPRSSARDALAARWSEAVAAMLRDFDALWVEAIHDYAYIDPIITQQLRYNHYLRVIFDYSGRERTLVAQIIASQRAPTPEQTAKLFRGDGILETSWAQSLVLAQASGLYAAIAPLYEDAKSEYDVLHGMLKDAFYTTTPRQDAFPLTLAFWFELSQQARESLYMLRQAARDEMDLRVDLLIADNQRAMALQGALFALALLVCGLSVWVIFRRVLHPIDAVVTALVNAVNGDVADFSVQSSSDEIDKLVEVLHALQSKVEDVRRGAIELDRSERRLRAVVDNAVDGLITTDAGGIVQSYNPACERMFGYAAAEIIGANVAALMQGEDKDYWSLSNAEQAAPAGEGGRELMARRKNGSVFPIELSIVGVKLPEGEYVSGIVRDITLRKQAEADLNAHTHALERSNKELDDFAYIASHDLKEPLRGIHNHSRFLLEDNENKLDEDSVRRLHRLLHLSQRMEQLVNDLLYFSRLGRHDLAVQSADLGEVIGDIESTLEHFLHENNAIIQIPAPLPTIHCDKTRVGEVFRNLITNAVKYNDSAEKRVEIGVAEAKRTPDGHLAQQAFYVADNGLGIAPEFHEEVFRIFKRLQARQSEKDGTGVGLTFVKKIVERHGGQIWIESTPGEGATFYFTLETPDDGELAHAA